MDDQNKIIDLSSRKNKTSPLRLALDIGTNSIGWALYDINKVKKPCRISGAGVRIFPSGRNPKDHTTLNASRRQARLQRRQRDRYLQRRTYLLHLLKKHDLFPKDRLSAEGLKPLNPYQLRAKGLDEKLDIYHFGRVLFHLNQKRGFKSNRKSLKEKETGLIKQSIQTSQNLMKKHKSRTYGEFLWRRFQKMEESRKHPGSQQENWVLARRAIGAGAKDNYAVYAERGMLKDEFSKLWESQERFHDKLKDKNLKSLFFSVIFKQRPLKKPIVGKCSLIPKENRISRSSPYFQRFRILKELNNLAYTDSNGRVHFINQMKQGLEFRDKLIKEHFLVKKQVSFSVLEKVFKSFFPDKAGHFSDFNLEAFGKKYLEGDQTGFVLKKIIPQWLKQSLDLQDQFIERLEGDDNDSCFMKEDKDILDDLKQFNQSGHLNLSDKQLEDCLSKEALLPAGHGGYSKKAIKKILPFLEKGQQEFEAVRSCGLEPAKTQTGDLLDKLPLYQKILSDHCIEMKSEKNPRNSEVENKNPKYKNFRIPNPTVHIAFNQLRLLVNDIIRVYGKPQQIVVETARDLPLGVIGKKELETQNKNNRKRNEKAKQFIEEFGETKNRDNRIRYQLWEEQKKSCVYSGKNIPKTKLFTSEVEVDHILPWSRTLDDGISNKTLVYKSANQNKGNQTPFEFFSSDEKSWPEILQRVKDLPKNKQWRFKENAIDRFNEEGGFLARQLNDTRYISKYARKYLECISPEVWVVRGQSTAVFRNLLQYEKKNRQDHRHHAKDALVIGLMDPAFVQHISGVAKQIEEKGTERLENIGKAIKKDVLPWPDFKRDAKNAVDKIVVSHRKRDKKEGALHNETAYSVSRGVRDFSDPVEVLHYASLLSLEKANKKKVSKIIVSSKIRADFLKELENSTALSKEFLKNYHKKTGVRRVRLKESKSVIPIKDSSKRTYKAFQSGSNYAMELFENTNGKWEGRVISRFEANQKNFKPVPKKNRLMAGDILFFEKRFWRLVKFDRNNILIFIEHFVSGNPDEIRKKKTKEQVSQKSPGSLQTANPKRVDISPCGKFTWTAFKLRKHNQTKLKKI